MAKNGNNRVNMTATVRREVKTTTELIADHDNTSASRIVENALLAYFDGRRELVERLRAAAST